MKIDVLDNSDPSDPVMRGLLDQYHRRGIRPILLAGMSNAVGEMVGQIIRRVSRRPGSIDLLRINGHGGPGVQGIAGGIYPNLDLHLADLSLRRFVTARPALEELVPYFAPSAQVWLLGCHTGDRVEGRDLIQMLANLWGIPVSASTSDEQDATAFTAWALGFPVGTCRPAGPGCNTVTARPQGPAMSLGGHAW